MTAKATFTGDTMGTLSTSPRAREFMFSAQTPESLVVDCVGRFQQESRRAIYLDLMFLNLPRPEIVTAPVLVLGAECDGSISAEEVRATARAYRTEAELFPGMGHDMMLEPEWATVAERIHTWLGARDLRLDDDGTSQEAISR
jgi:alpha-beta hydrolase superfamily lysophospholipase